MRTLSSMFTWKVPLTACEFRGGVASWACAETHHSRRAMRAYFIGISVRVGVFKKAAKPGKPCSSAAIHRMGSFGKIPLLFLVGFTWIYLDLLGFSRIRLDFLCKF